MSEAARARGTRPVLRKPEHPRPASPRSFRDANGTSDSATTATTALSPAATMSRTGERRDQPSDLRPKISARTVTSTRASIAMNAAA